MGRMIRVFRLGDLKKIVDIERRSFKDPYNPAIFCQFYHQFPDLFWVYEEGGEVRGYIMFTYETFSEAHLVNIAVEPGWRNRGIGKRLIESMIEFLRGRGIRRIKLEVRQSNVGAQRFYQRLGFILEETLPGYYGSEDAYIMVLYPHYVRDGHPAD